MDSHLSLIAESSQVSARFADDLVDVNWHSLAGHRWRIGCAVINVVKSIICMTTQLWLFLRHGLQTVMVLAITCLVPSVCHAATAYLAEVGPPAVRFDTVVQRSPVYPTEFSFDESKPKPSAKNEAPSALLLATSNTNQISDLTKNGSDGSSSPGGTNYVVSAFPFQTPATSSQSSVRDISVVTPQMILEFLKPGERGSGSPDGKGTAVVVPVKIDFTPPVPINNSSTAVYKQE